MPHALVIDDSSTARLYYREILEQEGFVVEEAMNGLEGLEKAMSQTFDLIVVDVNMPKMDGYAFLGQIRRSIDMRAVPAIMISTEAQETDRTKSYAAGANVYLVKPVDPAELAAYVGLITGTKSARRSAA